ncbi:hypothetical protein FA13DRAFT_1815531 [Coprinellus micaceus]|uniref:Nephrocystin 3-like N-terminal domain-containing protein n=1 Tax=Coprinellus micaceus TaxID=71717 RepID=A0A4Y7T4T5_COPMI|nr:hypothetical protein FA13DRAFT_1815531 [Coprinellus micaceus]
MAWFQSLFSTTKRSTALSAVDESGGESTSTGLVRTVSVQSQVTAVPAMEVLRETFRGGDTARRQDELIARLRKKKQDAEDECKPLETLPKQDLERYMVLSSRSTNALAALVKSKTSGKAHKRIKSAREADRRIDDLVIFGHQTTQARVNARVSTLLGIGPKQLAETSGAPSKASERNIGHENKFRSLVLHRATYDFASLSVAGFPSSQIPSLEASIRDIADWLDQARMSDRCIYWLWQERHDGRENVLRFVANRCGMRNALASSFFCSTVSNRELKSGFVVTLASELIRYVDAFRDALTMACNVTGDWVFEKGILTQVSQLLIKPFNRLPTEEKIRPLLVVVDSVDQCDEQTFLQVMSAVEKCIEEIPNIYFILSSKENQNVTRWFKGCTLLPKTRVGRYV